MITLAESGLTARQYAALQTQETYYAFKVIAHKANIEFDNAVTRPGSPWMAWNGADYIFWADPVFIVGSTHIYDQIKVYRYSISVQTNTLVYTASLGRNVSIKLTNPAMGIVA